jgi:GT2 family glycosyltransferase
MEEAVQAPPKVTAIVLSYNTAESLRRCLAALDRSQPRELLEILVADNCSQDESPTLDNEFPRTTFLRMPRNFGAAKALSIAIRTAAGDYIFFVAPEVEVEPETAAALSAVLDAEADVAAVCPLALSPDGTPDNNIWELPGPRALAGAWHDPDALPRVAVDAGGGRAAVEYAGLGALMARKFFIKGMNYFDERYGQFGPDLELAFQIQRAGRKLLFVPEARVVRHPPEPFDWTGGQRALISVDRGVGAAAYVAKHFGAFAGLKFRLGTVFHTLGGLLAMREPGFQFNRLVGLVQGRKVDGSQREL